MKLKAPQFLTYLFLVIAAFNLLGHWGDTEWLQQLTKPLLMLLLIAVFLSYQPGEKVRGFRLTLGALAFSWLGDLLLMFEKSGEDFFLFGLGSFLVAHLFYIFAFNQIKTEDVSRRPGGFVNLRILFLVFVGMSLYYLIDPGLGTYRLPVMIYMVVILAMAMSAVLRKGRTTDRSFILVYGGALLFILSDSMIALDKFLHPIARSGFWIMATYILAQYMIIRGILAHGADTGSDPQS